MEETRVVNETTGGEKGAKDVKLSLIPVEELWEVARLYNFGTKKYSPHNWRKGYDWSLSYDALNRHLGQFWEGESIDKETKCHHLASVVFHAFALMYFDKHYQNLDDRPGAQMAAEKSYASLIEITNDLQKQIFSDAKADKRVWDPGNRLWSKEIPQPTVVIENGNSSD